MENVSDVANDSSPMLDLVKHPAVQANIYALYVVIFSVGVCGNVLVCFVVCNNKAMQTVTNLFIANLALSDILLCVLAVPFTPLYFFLDEWIFGRVLCHMVAYSQGTSVYVSTLTLTSIAIDRFFVILYPFKPRMKMNMCITIICCIWLFALCATLPYGIFVNIVDVENRTYCEESWPSDGDRQAFGAVTTIMQFVVPFIIIALAYTKVSLKLADRSREKAKIRLKSCRGEELDRERKRRTNRMLIAMVTIFGISWLPLNLVNLLNDLSVSMAWWKYYNLCFFLAHTVAMSSTCYNVFLYAWLNDNFRKELKRILPCFRPEIHSRTSHSRMSRDDSPRQLNGSGKEQRLKKCAQIVQEAQILLPDGELEPEARIIGVEGCATVDVIEMVERVPKLTVKTPLETSTCPQCSTSTKASFITFDETFVDELVAVAPAETRESVFHTDSSSSCPVPSLTNGSRPIDTSAGQLAS